MRISTFFFLTRRGLRNLGKHWAMTIACIASLSVCMTLNSFASLAEVNVDSMVSYLGSQNETVVYLDPDCDDATATQVGEKLSTMPGVSGVQYGLNSTNSQLDEAYLSFVQVKHMTAELAEIENSVYRLADAIKKTQKRANALDNIMIPQFTATIKYITEALEEKEREDFSRLKVIKRQKEEKES